jgi:hypothetical protein
MIETMTDSQRPSTRHGGPPTDEELAELMDPESWDWDSAYIVEPDPARKATLGLTIRFDADEARILGDAARAAEMPLSRYIKLVALESAKRARKVISGQDTSKDVA